MATLFGMPVIESEYLETVITTYQYLHPVIGGHVWINGKIEEYPIYLIQQSLNPWSGPYIIAHSSVFSMGVDVVSGRFEVRTNEPTNIAH